MPISREKVISQYASVVKRRDGNVIESVSFSQKYSPMHRIVGSRLNYVERPREIENENSEKRESRNKVK